MLCLATVDLGRVYSLQHHLANASREGAVFAQYFPGQVSASGACADPDNITYHALGEDGDGKSDFTVMATNVGTGAVIAGCTTSGIAGGTRVKVTVSSPFTPLTPFASMFTGTPATVRRSTEVVVQG
jgi:hypothetical protein